MTAGKMPGKRKAGANPKEDDKKKTKGQTDWGSLDFSSDAKTGEKKVIYFCFHFHSTILMRNTRPGI